MNQKGRQLAIWGVALQLGAVVGLIGTIIGMVRAFARVAESQTAQSPALANDISMALYATVIGSGFALVGIIMILVALFQVQYRALWSRKSLRVFSVLWLISFPVGTILGIVVMVYLKKHKTEFTEQSPAGDVRSGALVE